MTNKKPQENKLGELHKKIKDCSIDDLDYYAIEILNEISKDYSEGHEIRSMLIEIKDILTN